MIYRFLMLSEENDFFKREIRIDADATFRDLNDFILSDANYDPRELTTFHICDDDWNKKQEITLMDMDMGSEFDSFLMDDTVLSDLIQDKGQKLLFVFDMLSERAFFLELAGIITGETLEKPKATIREGNPPKQTSDIDVASSRQIKNQRDYDFDDDLYGDDEFSMDEIDSEGFSDIDSLEDLY